MTTAYDNIQTAEELIREVISNGLNIEQNHINRAADIMGNTSVGALAVLANDERTVSGKRICETCYFILFSVWNWRQAVNFYNEHTLKIREKDETIKRDRATMRNIEEHSAQLEKFNAELRKDNENTRNAFEEAQREIIALKAKLYDLMTVGRAA